MLVLTWNTVIRPVYNAEVAVLILHVAIAGSKVGPAVIGSN